MGSYPGGDNAIHLYRPFKCDGISVRDAARAFIDKRFLAEPSIKEAHLRTPRWFRAAHMALMKLENRVSP